MHIAPQRVETSEERSRRLRRRQDNVGSNGDDSYGGASGRLFLRKGRRWNKAAVTPHSEAHALGSSRSVGDPRHVSAYPLSAFLSEPVSTGVRPFYSLLLEADSHGSRDL